MKAAGFVLLQTAALVYALQRIRTRDREAGTLRDFCALLSQLYGILEAEAAPMPELLQALSERCDGAAGDFARRLHARLGELGPRSFRDLWDETLRENVLRMYEDQERGDAYTDQFLIGCLTMSLAAYIAFYSNDVQALTDSGLV